MKKTRFLINFALVLTLLSCVLMFTACDSAAQKKANAENEARGQQNAIEYVKQKYGFTPAVVSATIDRIPGGYGGTATSNVLVTLKHEGKEFIVFISGSTENTNGADNYQSDKIFEDFKKALNEKLPGLLALTCYASGRVQSDEMFVFSPKYDGTNLKEVLTDGLSGFDAGYADLDLDNEEQLSFASEFLSPEDKDVCFVSLRGNAYEVDFEKYGLSFVKERSVMSHGYIDLHEKKCFKYDLQNINEEVYYCAMPNDEAKAANITVTSGDIGNPYDFRLSNEEVITQFTKAYTVTADDFVSVFEVYYPMDDLSREILKHKCYARRLEYSDGTVKTDRMFSVSNTGGMLRVSFSVPRVCKVTFCVLNVVEEKKTE